MPALEDSIRLETSPPPSASPPSRVLIYLIPGNPGLISYYRPFLIHLQSSLQPLAAERNTTLTIIGHSLAGFHTSPTSSSTGTSGPQQLPLNLSEQIEDVESSLLSTIASGRADRPGRQDEPAKVILIGHSVGAYILVSLLDRQLRDPNPSVKILAGVGLFPTIIDLHASPNGRKAAWIAPIPGLSRLVQGLAKLLCCMITFETLVALVAKITGQPEQAAKVTAAFLASSLGVRQAVYLAQHELRDMREDKFSPQVWGGRGKADWRLFFYFGSKDHWVADETRDKIIASHAGTTATPSSVDKTGGRGQGPHMEIDTVGTPHDFCVRKEHSRAVAEKVVGFVREVMEGR